MSKDQLHVVGIGNAIVDVLCMTEDVFLTSNRINKGTMTLIEADKAEILYSKMGTCTEMSGGSVANSIAALSSMGANTGFIGKVSNDQLGAVFRHDIRATGVTFNTAPLQAEAGAPTARCLIMITPDAQRTMCTYLGACTWISPDDVDVELIRAADVTYLEGYLFDRNRAKLAFRKAADIAHAAGRKVALTLSDPFCVERHRAEFLELVENHVDILFANEAEIMSLYQTEHFEDALKRLGTHCELIALTRGEKGSLIMDRQKIVEVPVEPVAKIVDTTGAGDLYAAGFLYGYTRKKTLAECGKIAAIAAAEIISQVGARSQRSLSKLLQERNVA